MASICFYGYFLGRGTERATVELANMLCDTYELHILNTAGTELTYVLDQRVAYATIQSNGVINTIFSLRKYLRQYKIDVLIAVEALSGITAMPAAKLAKSKLIIWDHGNYFQTKGSKYMNITRKIELLFCDAYVVLTDRDIKLYREHFKHIKTRLTRIYNAVQFPRQNTYDCNAKTIISIGHIDRNKNFQIIPKMAYRLLSEHSDWCWEIYGTGEQSDIEELQEGIRQYGLEDQIKLKGFVSDICSVYRNASFYVMTSFYEGFPLVLIEAKSYGLPLISFDIDTGPDEIIRDGVNGYLVKPFDTEEMSARIGQLMEEPERRKAFSANSHLDLELLDPARIQEQWKQLLNELLR